MKGCPSSSAKPHCLSSHLPSGSEYHGFQSTRRSTNLPLVEPIGVLASCRGRRRYYSTHFDHESFIQNIPVQAIQYTIYNMLLGLLPHLDIWGHLQKTQPFLFLRNTLCLSFPALKQLHCNQVSTRIAALAGTGDLKKSVIRGCKSNLFGFKNNIYLQHESIRNGNGLCSKDWSLFWQGYVW